MGTWKPLSLVLWLLVPAYVCFAQVQEPSEAALEAETILKLRAELESREDVPAETRSRLSAQYEEAIGHLARAEASETQVRSLERQIAGTNRLIEALREELAQLPPEVTVSLPDDATATSVEQTLTRRRSQLTAYMSALRDLEELSEQRANRRIEIARRLGAIDRETEIVSDELRRVADSLSAPRMLEATRYNLIARRQSLTSESEALRTELTFLDTRAGLLPLQRDQAQRRVSRAQRRVALLEETASKLRHQEAEESLKAVRKQCAEFREKVPSLARLADENELFAERLWGPDGAVLSSEATAIELVAARQSVDTLNRLIQTVRRYFAAVGLEDITSWWPTIPADMPRIAEIEDRIAAREQLVPVVQRNLLDFEERRAQVGDVSRRTRELADELASQGASSVSEDHEALIRRILTTRRELLDELIRGYGRYSNQMVELDGIYRHFVHEAGQARDFLFEHQLWARSVPGSLVPSPMEVLDALRWYVSSQNWREVMAAFGGAISSSYTGSSLVLLVFAALLGLRSRIRGRLIALGERAKTAPSTRDSFEALLHTVLLAAPLPYLLYILGAALGMSPSLEFATNTAVSITFMAPLAGAFELLRNHFHPSGMAERQLGWNSEVTRALYRGLKWPELLFLPVYFVAGQFAAAGLELASAEHLRAHNNSLGRIIFIVAMVLLAASLLYVFRPRRKVHRGQRPGWFAQVSLYSYPVIFLLAILPAILAVLGRYYTAYVVSEKLVPSLWLAIALVLLGNLFYRWYALRVSAAASGETGSTITAAQSGITRAASSSVQEEQLRADAQVRGFFRFAVIAIAAIGAVTIWTDVIPSLYMFKRIEIWPELAWRQAEIDDLVGLPTTGAAAGATPEASQESASGTAAPGLLGTLPSEGSEGSPEDQSTPITLWILGKAIIMALITIALVRDMPGLLDLAFLRRTRLDPGARIAVVTLVRYTIAILGSVATFQTLGISWSKVQWLAAALTFGLGFGLQEIVANFVSGIILLAERPIRVGDAVSIGNLSGLVTRIRIRSTTISMWDRSEMIVPNKEFVTQKLINWTLSDNRTRVDIPVRVAYGSDIQQVKDVLLQVGHGHPATMDDPAPKAVLVEFGEAAVHLELRVFVDYGFGRVKAKDELQMAIDKAFREAGIAFAIPAYRLESGAPEPKKVAPPPKVAPA